MSRSLHDAVTALADFRARLTYTHRPTGAAAAKPATRGMQYTRGVGGGRSHRGALPTGHVNVSPSWLYEAATR
jgi:hypothetical protein